MYKVIDWYEGYEEIGEYDTKKEAKAVVRERVINTDSECDCEIIEVE